MVARSGSNVNAISGFVNVVANYDSSNANFSIGSRIAFRGVLEIVE